MPSDIVSLSHAPGQTVTANVVGGAAQTFAPSPGLPPDGIMPSMPRNWTRRIMEVLMPAPARVIPLPQPPARVRPSADWPLARYVQWWLDNATGGLAPESRRVYRYVTDAMIEDSGDIALSDLTPADLQCTIGRMQAAGKSDATVALAKAGISSALGSAVRLGILGSNPAAAISAPDPEVAERTVLTPAQVARLVDYLGNVKPWSPVNAVLAVMLQTGVRIHEAVAPRMADLDLDSAAPTLRVQYQAAYEASRGWHRRKPKSRRGRRTIPLPDGAVAIVRRRLELHPRPPVGDDWALGSALNRPYSDSAIGHALRRACQVTGAPPIQPHECRTSYATNLARCGVDIVTLAALLGDTTDTVTKHYVKTDSAQAAAAVARLFAPSRTDAALS